MELRSPRSVSVVRRAEHPLEALEGRLQPGLFQFLEQPGLHSLAPGPLPPPSKPICSILLQSSLPSSVSNPLLPPPRKDPPDHREDHLDSPGASTHLRILKLITSATHPLPRKLTWLQTPGIQAWIFLWLLLSQLPSQELKTKS